MPPKRRVVKKVTAAIAIALKMCSLRLIYPQLKRNKYFCICMNCLLKWNENNKYVDATINVRTLYFWKYSSLLDRWQFDSLTSAGARTGIVRFVWGFSKAHGACQSSYDARPVSVEIGWLRLPGARPMCEIAGQAPYGSVRCHLTINDPTKRRTGAMNLVP